MWHPLRLWKSRLASRLPMRACSSARPRRSMKATLPGLASNMCTMRPLPAKTSTTKSRRSMATWVRLRRFVRVLLQRRKGIVCGRRVFPRDIFQMKDATRGPAMHTEQFDGLTWLAVPLFDKVRVWLWALPTRRLKLPRLRTMLASMLWRSTTTLRIFLEERFPNVRRVLLGGGNFDELSNIAANPADYACVLTRGAYVRPRGVRVVY